MEAQIKQSAQYLKWIKIISVVIPVAVAILIYLPQRLQLGDWVRILPLLNATINSITSVLLIIALIMIKRKDIVNHQRFMMGALVLGAIFLLSYVLYHASVPSVKFGDIDHDGILSAQELNNIADSRKVYLFVLLSHIGLSIVVVPLVLFSFYFSLSGQIERHKRLVRFSYPIWLYVSLTGVLVYYLISPYYF